LNISLLRVVAEAAVAPAAVVVLADLELELGFL
jgi:hypothetical protein